MYAGVYVASAGTPDLYVASSGVYLATPVYESADLHIASAVHDPAVAADVHVASSGVYLATPVYEPADLHVASAVHDPAVAADL